MLVKFFKSSFAAQYIALLVLAFFLWLPAFLDPLPYAGNDGLSPATKIVASLLGSNPLLAVIIAFLLLLVEAIFFNAILAANGLISRVSSLGAFVYILLMSQVQYQTALYDYLLAALLILATIHTILLLYDSKDPTYYLYNTGLFTGLASLLYFPSTLLMVWLWICLLVYQSMFFRRWVISLIGFLTPYFFMASWFYLTDQLAIHFSMYLELKQRIVLTMNGIHFSEWLSGIVILVIMLVSFGVIYGRQSEKNVNLRMRIRLNSWLFIIAFLTVFYEVDNVMLNGMVLIPTGVIISYYLSYTRKQVLPQLLLLVLIGLIFMNHYLFI